MPPQNKIVKLGLESRANELFNQNLSLTEIGNILSEETQQPISKFTLSRYFASEAHLKARVIEKKTELQLTLTEAEISTIEDRQTVIQGLLGIAQQSENEHNRILAYRTATEALDSLDKRLGKLTSNQGVTINNINAMKLSDIPTDQLLRMANDARNARVSGR